MRYVEIMSGVRVQVSKEERAVLSKGDAADISVDDLNEREQEVARKMVTKGLLHRLKRDDTVFYRPNTWID